MPDYTARVAPASEQGSVPALTVHGNGADVLITIAAATPSRMQDTIAQR